MPHKDVVKTYSLFSQLFQQTPIISLRCSCDKELKARPLPAGKVPHCYADLEEQEEEEEEAKESESVEENAEAGASRKRNYRKRSN